MEEPRFLALDWGSKRIGVAVSDPLGFSAQGLTVLERRDEESDLARLGELVEKYRPAVVVVGLPRNMNGSLGPQAEKAQELASRLEARSGVSLVFWDERLSSEAAERTLLEADLSRRKRRRVRDKMAAVHILQGFLDRRRRA